MIVNININGEDKTFKFGLGFLGDLLDGLGMGFIELSNNLDNNPFKYIPLVMMYSYNASNEEKITIETLIEWLEADGGMHSVALGKFRESYVLSMTKNVPQIENLDKKKVKK